MHFPHFISLRNISFGACLVAWNRKTSSCNGFFYSNATCHLLSTTHSGVGTIYFNATLSSSYQRGVLFFRTAGEQSAMNFSEAAALPDSLVHHSRGVSTSRMSAHRNKHMAHQRDDVLKTAGQLYKTCLLARVRRVNMLSPAERSRRRSAFSQRPLINIVLSTTRAMVERDRTSFQRVVNHWKCYAKIHSYNCTVNVMDSPRGHMDPLNFMNSSQYTLFLDANSVTLNMSKSLEPFLLSKKSILLQMKDSSAISSAIMLFRNDDSSRCFLSYVRLFHQGEQNPLAALRKLGSADTQDILDENKRTAEDMFSVHSSHTSRALGGAMLGLLPERGTAILVHVVMCHDEAIIYA